MMDVLNFGSLNLDYVYRLPHTIRPGETLTAAGRQVFPGGKGLNQSVALARAGVRVAHAGKLGPDGALLRRTLADAGVDTSLLIAGDGPSGHAVILVDGESGQNSIILDGGANRTIRRDEITATLDRVPAGAWLLLQNEINELPFLISSAADRGLKIALNPAPCTPEVRDYPLARLDLLIVNEVEAEQLSGAADPEVAATRLLEIAPRAGIVLTLGSRGALYRSAAERVFQPALPAEVVDTTAAGDTFIGYFLAARLRGCDVAAAMLAASRASAIAIGRPGAAVSIPTAAEIFN